MAKRHIPKYIVEIEYSTPHLIPLPLVWQVRADGAPTKENLEAYRIALNASFKRGGANAVSKGIVPHISKARIVTTSRFRKVVAETTMPMFEVV